MNCLQSQVTTDQYIYGEFKIVIVDEHCNLLGLGFELGLGPVRVLLIQS